MTILDGIGALGVIVMVYAALATYYAIIYKRQLRALQKKIEDYESAATFAQAGDFKDAIEIRNHDHTGTNHERRFEDG